MDTGSFYREGMNVMSGFASTTEHVTPPLMPRHTQDSILGMNQKLDRMLTLFTEQKSAIEIKRQMDSFSASLREIIWAA